MDSRNLFEKLCAGLQGGSHVGELEDGSLIYELPLTYSDESAIELKVAPDGEITDDGRTLLRLLAEGRLDALEHWEGFQGFCRTHRMARRGVELEFIGDTEEELYRFLEGVRRLEVQAPSPRERSKAFNHVIRRQVKEYLSTQVRENRISSDVRNDILHPEVTVDVRREPENQLISVPVNADFISRGGTDVVVVLSYGGENKTRRLNHIRRKLAEHTLLQRNTNLRSVAVIPEDGEYDRDSIDLIIAFSGSKPLELSREDGGEQLARRLLTAEGPFSE